MVEVILFRWSCTLGAVGDRICTVASKTPDVERAEIGVEGKPRRVEPDEATTLDAPLLNSDVWTFHCRCVAFPLRKSNRGESVVGNDFDTTDRLVPDISSALVDLDFLDKQRPSRHWDRCGQLPVLTVERLVRCIEEEMIFGIVIGTQHKACARCTAICTEDPALGSPLRGNGFQKERTELEIGSRTEERLGTTDERTVGRQLDIPKFDELDDVVIVAFVADLETVIEFKLPHRVPVGAEPELIPNPRTDVELDVLGEHRR